MPGNSPGHRPLRELSGFLLPGFAHEFKNLLGRISLLSEMPEHTYPLSSIRKEIRTPEFSFLFELMRVVSSPSDNTYEVTYGPDVSEITVPTGLEPLFRVLRSSVRGSGRLLRIADLPTSTIHGNLISISVGLGWAVLAASDQVEPDEVLELDIGAVEDKNSGAVMFTITSEGVLLSTYTTGA